MYGAVGTIEITYAINNFKIGAPIYPSDIHGVPRDGLKQEGEYCIEVCGVPFTVEVVGLKQSRYEMKPTTPNADVEWDARLNK